MRKHIFASFGRCESEQMPSCMHGNVNIYPQRANESGRSQFNYFYEFFAVPFGLTKLRFFLSFHAAST